MTQAARRGQAAARGQVQQPQLSSRQPLCSRLSFPGAREALCGGMHRDGSAPTPGWVQGGLLVSGGPGAGTAGEFPLGCGRSCWPLRGLQRRGSIWLQRCMLERMSEHPSGSRDLSCPPSSYLHVLGSCLPGPGSLCHRRAVDVCGTRAVVLGPVDPHAEATDRRNPSCHERVGAG